MESEEYKSLPKDEQKKWRKLMLMKQAEDLIKTNPIYQSGPNRKNL